jgi:predicted nucleic acid-binding protein
MMMPDVNLLVASADPSHTLHGRAIGWLNANTPVATCALTELGMLRILIRLGTPVKKAEIYLAYLIKTHRKMFIPCDLSADALAGLIAGHQQVTDRYLVELCARHNVKLATLDKSIPGAHLVT